MRQEQAALEVQVGAPFDVEGLPAFSASASANVGQVACGMLRCMIFYSQQISGAGFSFGSRLSADGALQDSPRLQLPDAGAGSTVKAVAARGDEFLVLWTGPGLTGASSPIGHITRVQGATGAMDDLTSKAPSAALDGIAVTASRTLITYYDGAAAATKFIVFDTAFNPVGGDTLGVPKNADPGVLVAGGDQFLALWSSGAQRIDATTAALLDATPIAYSRYKQGVPAAAYLGGTYQIGWPLAGDLYGSRIRASDGVVLDPDDTFNEISGAKILCAACSGNASVLSNVRVNALGDSALFSWVGTPGNGNSGALLVAARVSPVTGLRVDGISNAPELTTSVTGQDNLVLSGANGLLLNGNQIESVAITAAPLAFSAGSPSPVALESAPRSSPVSASNGTDFLALWLVDGELRGSRIDGGSGAYLDTPPLDLGAGSSPAVAAVGSDYLVAWLDSSLNIQRRLVSKDGTLGDVIAQAIAAKRGDETSAPNPSSVKLTYNGKYLFLSWLFDQQAAPTEVRALRLSAAGVAIEPAFVTIATGIGYGAYAVLADTPLDESTRTFLVVASDATTSALIVHRFRSELGALLSDTTQVGVGAGVLGATSAAQSLLAYQTVDGAREQGQFLDPTAGVSMGSTVPLLKPATNYSSQLLWWDGVSFVLASLNQPFASPYLNLFARRFDASLAALDDALPGAGALLAGSIFADHSELSVSSNGKGRSLLLSEQLSPTHLGFAIRAEFLDNDGIAAPPQTASGDAGQGGESGDSGEAGEAGNSALASGGSSAPGGSSGASGRAGMGGATSSANGGAAPGGDSSTKVAPSLSSCSMSPRRPTSGLAWSLAAVAAALSVRRRRMLYAPHVRVDPRRQERARDRHRGPSRSRGGFFIGASRREP